MNPKNTNPHEHQAIENLPTPQPEIYRSRKPEMQPLSSHTPHTLPTRKIKMI
jgi:hypothetical protein